MIFLWIIYVLASVLIRTLVCHRYYFILSLHKILRPIFKSFFFFDFQFPNWNLVPSLISLNSFKTLLLEVKRNKINRRG